MDFRDYFLSLKFRKELMRRLSLILCCLSLAIACKSGVITTVPPAGDGSGPAEEPPVRPSSLLDGKEELSKAETADYAAFLEGWWTDSVKYALNDAFREKVIKHDKLEMKLDWKTFGTAPAEGRALYISLHGGGGAPAETNDQQWRNQMTLYQPAEGIYLCPRGITNTWDLHFRPESDGFYEDVIHMAVAHLGVNPDKVYLMGYSAGGDGVWRIAPRMADHWAAASMMAGHPGDVRLESLRNLPFMIWCGENDAAYDRNKVCAEKIEEMAALHAADPEGYIYEGHIVKGKEHWMDLEDAAAVPWMAKFKRNPNPDKVVWVQGDEKKAAFYWLGVPLSQAAKGKKIEAHIDGNTVKILSSDYTAATIYLNDTMMDLDKPVRVVFGEKVLFEGPVSRKPAVMRQTLREREDRSYIFPVRIDVTL